MHAEALRLVAHDARAELPSITSVPISGRAGVSVEAPEIDTSKTLHASMTPSASASWLTVLLGAMRSCRRSAVSAISARLASQVSWGELLTLVMSGLNAKGEAALAAAYHRALDATEVIEISNDAFAELDADRRQQRRAAGGCIHQPAGVLLLVGTHEAAEQGDREPLVAPTIRRNARKDAQRAAGEGRRAA